MRSVVLAAFLVATSAGLLLQPAARFAAPPTIAQSPRFLAASRVAGATPRMQFGDPGDKLTRDNEPEEVRLRALHREHSLTRSSATVAHTSLCCLTRSRRAVLQVVMG